MSLARLGLGFVAGWLDSPCGCWIVTAHSLFLPSGFVTAPSSSGKSRCFPHGTPWPNPDLAPLGCPLQSCPALARQGFPPTEALRGRHRPPGREGRRRPSGMFPGASSASGMLWRGEGGWEASALPGSTQAAAIQNVLSSRKKPVCL